MYVFLFSSVNAGEKKCEKIRLNKDLFFEVTAYIDGPRGTLKFPAIIDTGASHTVIPRSIADGIGYKNEKSARYFTAGGMKTFKIINAEKLAFLGVSFKNVSVAISEQKNQYFNPLLTSNDMFFNNKYNKKKPVEDKRELALIGMSELSKTVFNYSNNILTICRK